MKKFELSENQRKIANKAIDNCLRKKQKSAITGEAGSGKTTIAEEISNILFQHEMNVYFAAPTHTASNRLQKVLSDGNDRGISVSTVHKFLGMRVIKNEFGKMTFGLSDETKPLDDNSILIVDEFSMLNDELYRYIHQICGHRVIFLGDSCQIPPVTENDDHRSRILTVEDSVPPVSRHVDNVFELTKVYRQNNDSALYQLCKFIRESILDGTCVEMYDDKRILINKITELCKWNDDSLFMDIPGSDVVPSIINIPDTCFLGFGNPTVSAVQQHLPKWYVNGGYAITNGAVFKAVHIDGKDKFTMILANNDHVQILEIIPNDLRMWGITFDKVKVIGEHSGEVYVYVPSNQEAFQDDYQNWINVAKYNEGHKVQLTSRQMADYKYNDYMTLTNKSMNQFVASVTTLREGRASTIHRAQGQQWNNCIIAFNNIMYAGVNTDNERRNKDVHRKIIAMKLLYTAISRAKEKVVFCFETKKENYIPRSFA